MKQLLLFILLAIFSMPLQAGDSGSYFNPERAGEGMFFDRDGDKVFFGIFTFGEDRCVPIVPEISPRIATEMCSFNGQRWFTGLGNFNPLSDTVSGQLYISDAVDFPFAFMGQVSEANIVGLFIMFREGDGFVIHVTRFGSRLEPSDHLFAELLEFTSRATEAKD